MFRRFATLHDASVAAADEIEAICMAAVAERGRASVALSGGETPKLLYTLLAHRSLPWPLIDFFWSDERAVAPSDRESNYAMAKEALLDAIGSPCIHRMMAELPNREQAADEYAAEIRSCVLDGRFDLILLGLGADGHTASLFPGTAALTVATRWVVPNVAPTGQRRLTFTYPLINRARNVLFLVAGEAKANVVAAVLEGPRNRLPAQGVQAASVVWLLDAAAAQSLGKVPQ